MLARASLLSGTALGCCSPQTPQIPSFCVVFPNSELLQSQGDVSHVASAAHQTQQHRGQPKGRGGWAKPSELPVPRGRWALRAMGALQQVGTLQAVEHPGHTATNVPLGSQGQQAISFLLMQTDFATLTEHQHCSSKKRSRAGSLRGRGTMAKPHRGTEQPLCCNPLGM